MRWTFTGGLNRVCLDEAMAVYEGSVAVSIMVLGVLVRVFLLRDLWPLMFWG